MPIPFTSLQCTKSYIYSAKMFESSNFKTCYDEVLTLKSLLPFVFPITNALKKWFSFSEIILQLYVTYKLNVMLMSSKKL